MMFMEVSRNLGLNLDAKIVLRNGPQILQKQPCRRLYSKLVYNLQVERSNRSRSNPAQPTSSWRATRIAAAAGGKDLQKTCRTGPYIHEYVYIYMCVCIYT